MHKFEFSEKRLFTDRVISTIVLLNRIEDKRFINITDVEVSEAFVNSVLFSLINYIPLGMLCITDITDKYESFVIDGRKRLKALEIILYKTLDINKAKANRIHETQQFILETDSGISNANKKELRILLNPFTPLNLL